MNDLIHKEVYGFIDPNGHFYPVPWSDHTSFAFHIVDTNKQYMDIFKQVYKDDDFLYPSKALDFLVFHLNWIVIHDPGLSEDLSGLLIEKSAMPATKKQKEAIFDWYKDIDLNIANQLYNQLD